MTLDNSRFTVNATFGPYWQVRKDGRVIDTYSSAGLAQSYCDYMNGRAR